MRLFFFLIGLVILACNNEQQPTNTSRAMDSDSVPVNNAVATPPSTVSTDSAIAYIRNTFQQINALNLKSEQFDWEAENCGEGTATYYLTPTNEIAKVVETGAIGDGSWTIAYYYKAGHFVFSLETNIGGPAVGPVDTFTIRKYVYNDRLVRMTANNTPTPLTDSTLTAASKEYRILEAYQNKNFGAAFCE